MSKNLILILICFIFATSIKAQKSKDLIGSWEFTKLLYKGEYVDKDHPESSKKTLFKMIQETDQSVRESDVEASYGIMMMVFDMMKYTFAKGGKITLAGTSGTYTLKNNILTLSMSDPKLNNVMKTELKDGYLIVTDVKATEDGGKMFFSKIKK